jgi:hypothetical protein
LRSCKQIEKESGQLLEVAQFEEALNNFVRQATSAVFNNVRLLVLKYFYSSQF